MNNAMGEAGMQMPRYRCHKEVWALKIVSVEEKGSGYELSFVDASYLPIQVGQAWAESHHVAAGGYYVVYEDGYKSWSPAKAFEEGYTLLQ